MLSHPVLRLALLATALTALGACEKKNGNDLAALDAQLASNKAEPAPAPNALQNQIVVDPNLVDSANASLAAPTPQGKADVAAALARAEKVTGAGNGTGGNAGGCADKMVYGKEWADRLPADLAVYPGARLTEAAGNLTAPCNLVVASYSAKAAIKPVVDHYAAEARKAGFAASREADGKDQVLGGTRARDDAAFIATFSPRADGGTDIDIVSRPTN